MHCLRPDAVVEAAANFVAGFPGDVLYAVKCNPDPAVLLAVWDGGVRHFDCASAPEVALVRRLLPDAAIHFMHPVKSRPGIRAAAPGYGISLSIIPTNSQRSARRPAAAASLACSSG